MKIEFQNLGCIDNGSIDLNDFTILCGKNNSGKTYAMYSIYGLLDNKFKISFDFVKPIIDKLKQEGNICLDIDNILSEHKDEMIQHIEERSKDHLSTLFGVMDNEFFNTKIRLNFSDSPIKERHQNGSFFQYTGMEMGKRWLFSINVDYVGSRAGKIELSIDNTDITGNQLQSFISETLVDILFFRWSIFKDSFLLPAERAGINIFFKELFSIRNLLLQQAQNDNVDPMFLLKDIVNARYPEPIKDYLQYLSQISLIREKASDYQKYAQKIETDVLSGKYQIDDVGNVYFKPYQSKNTLPLPLHFSSSTVKTLFGLVFYLEHLAKEGDYLMIDEPELNLHPDNQRQVARILAQLVNAGLKVIVSTHSDYFVRELNNLIMLNKDFKGAKELQEKYGYQDNELLSIDKVSAYLFDNRTITPMELDKDEGIIATTFDEVINTLNQSSNEIYYAMQDANEEH